MRIERQLMKGPGPAAVLRLLSDGEMSGHGLVQSLGQHAKHALPTGESALYALLYNLQAKGLVASRLDESGPWPRPRYRLTNKGRRRAAGTDGPQPRPDSDKTPGAPGVGADRAGGAPSADLPDVITSYLLPVVRRTRLWKPERERIAAELTAHFQDALAAGRNAANLIEAFGDPKTAARLIRRAMIRNRSLVWHLSTRFHAAFCLLLLLYVLAGVYLSLKKPAPSVDYAARMTAAQRAAPDSEKAWPIYKPAWIEHDFWRLDIHQAEVSVGNGRPRLARPGDPGWPRAKAFVEQRRSLLDAARLGAQKPFHGLPMGFPHDFTDEERFALSGPASQSDPPDRVPANPRQRIASGPLWSDFLLPPLGLVREMAMLLSLDTQIGVESGDSVRLVENTRAMLGLARQSRGCRTVIEQLVAFSILNLAVETVSSALHEHPDAIRDDDLRTLAREFDDARALAALDMTAEKWNLLDLIQRIYSDDGRCGGVLTADGLRNLGQAGHDIPKQETVLEAVPYVFVLPAVVAMRAGRREVTSKVEEIMSLVEQDLRTPLWKTLRDGARADAASEPIRSSKQQHRRYFPVSVLILPYASVLRARGFTQAQTEAVGVALALEIFRRREGRYPDALAELVPRDLPAVPLDHSTGEPLLMRIVEGKPLLYGRGIHGQDLGGERPAPGERWDLQTSPCNWVLYPPVFEPELPAPK